MFLFPLLVLVVGRNQHSYQFRSKQVPQNVFEVPIKVMSHRLYPKDILDKDGFLKIGVELLLNEKMLIGNKPRHECNMPTPENILEYNNLDNSVKPLNFNTQSDLNALIAEYRENLDKFDADTQKEVLRILSNGNRNEACNYLRQLRNKLLFPQEDGMIEYKPTFLSPVSGDENYQLREIIKTLVGFANNEAHKGTLIVGIKDGIKVCGVENDFMQFGKQYNKEKFTAMFLNLYSTLASPSLMLQTKLDWFSLDGHLICKLDVNYKGDIVLMDGINLYVRKDGRTHRLKGAGMLSFIRRSGNSEPWGKNSSDNQKSNDYERN